ncbi:unnamed protein product [Polarella glacialis]|uniref:Uncharacterized protein n=1 Tax=Polarella glacialis TaxID=89957 RepID=A0A813IB67_POLGL|nr:unnamed protein product [Polarella glacialis]
MKELPDNPRRRSSLLGTDTGSLPPPPPPSNSKEEPPSEPVRRRSSVPKQEIQTKRRSSAFAAGGSTKKPVPASEGSSSSESESSSVSSCSDEPTRLSVLACEATLWFRPRRVVTTRRRSTITEDRSASRFITMLEDALDELCGFRPWQIELKNVDRLAEQTTPEGGREKGGWQVVMWIYALDGGMSWQQVFVNLQHHIIDKYKDLAGPLDKTHHDFFQMYMLTGARLRNREEALAQIAQGTLEPPKVSEPQPIPAIPVVPADPADPAAHMSEQFILSHYEDVAVSAHFNIEDTKGTMVDHPVKLKDSVREAIFRYTGVPEGEILIQAFQSSDQVSGHHCQQWTVHVSIEPLRISVRRARHIQKSLVTFLAKGHLIAGTKSFFDSFSPASKVHVETSLFSENLGPLVSPTLVGCHTSSMMHAHADLYIESGMAGTKSRRFSPVIGKFVSALAFSLGLPVQHVQVRSVVNLSGGECLRVFFEVKHTSETPTALEMRQLQIKLASLKNARSMVDDSMVIDSAIRHAHGYDPGVCGHDAPPLCAHLDIVDQSHAMAFHGQVRWGQEFVKALQALAVEFRVAEPLDIQFKQIRQRADNKYTIDFKVKARSPVELRLVQELLWALHQADTTEWAKSQKLDFYEVFKVTSSARICAVKTCADVSQGHGFVPVQVQTDKLAERPSIWAELDVADRLGSFQRNGAAHFAGLLGDALHVLAGTEAARVSVIDVRQNSRSFSTSWPGAVGLNPQPRYKVRFEVDWTGDRIPARDLRVVYEAICELHSETTRRRWGELPLLQQYDLEACTEVAVHERAEDGSEDALNVRTGLFHDVVMPKLCVHLDLLDANPRKPFHEDKNGMGWTIKLQDMLVKALAKACDIPENLILVSCVQLRHAQRQHPARVQALIQEQHKLEIDLASSSRTALLHLGASPTAGGYGPAAVAGYTVELEIYCINEQGAQEMADSLVMAGNLRAFHSEAVRRQHQQLEFFQNFTLDYGLQLQQDSGCSDHKPREQHLLPRKSHPHACGPTVFSGSNTMSELEGNERIVMNGHVNIIERRDTSIGLPLNGEHQIREWFLQVLGKHLQTMCEVTHHGFQADNWRPSQDGRRATLHLRPVGSQENRLFLWDGLLLTASGVRKRGAQTMSVATNKLKNGEAGLEKACMMTKLDAYRIDFEVRRIADGEEAHTKFADDVRQQLHTFLEQAGTVPDIVFEDFYKRFEFDRGVQIDSLNLNDGFGSVTDRMLDLSMSPEILQVTLRFAAKEKACTADDLKKLFNLRVPFILGVQLPQVTIIEFKKDQPGMCEVMFQVATLTHKPATAEVEALKAKLIALDGNCSLGRRWWCEQFSGWMLVSVSVAPDKPHPGSSGSMWCADFSIEFEGVQPSWFALANREALLLEELSLELGFQKLRFASPKIGPCGTSGTSVEIQVQKLRDKFEAEALVGILLRASQGLLLRRSSWPRHKVSFAKTLELPPGALSLHPLPIKVPMEIILKNQVEGLKFNDEKSLLSMYVQEWKDCFVKGTSVPDGKSYYVDQKKRNKNWPLRAWILEEIQKRLRKIFLGTDDPIIKHHALGISMIELRDFAWACLQAVFYHHCEVLEKKKGDLLAYMESLASWDVFELKHAVSCVTYAMQWHGNQKDRLEEFHDTIPHWAIPACIDDQEICFVLELCSHVFQTSNELSLTRLQDACRGAGEKDAAAQQIWSAARQAGGNANSKGVSVGELKSAVKVLCGQGSVPGFIIPILKRLVGTLPPDLEDEARKKVSVQLEAAWKNTNAENNRTIREFVVRTGGLQLLYDVAVKVSSTVTEELASSCKNNNSGSSYRSWLMMTDVLLAFDEAFKSCDMATPLRNGCRRGMARDLGSVPLGTMLEAIGQKCDVDADDMFRAYDLNLKWAATVLQASATILVDSFQDGNVDDLTSVESICEDMCDAISSLNVFIGQFQDDLDDPLEVGRRTNLVGLRGIFSIMVYDVVSALRDVKVESITVDISNIRRSNKIRSDDREQVRIFRALQEWGEVDRSELRAALMSYKNVPETCPQLAS